MGELRAAARLSAICSLIEAMLRWGQGRGVGGGQCYKLARDGRVCCQMFGLKCPPASRIPPYVTTPVRQCPPHLAAPSGLG